MVTATLHRRAANLLNLSRLPGAALTPEPASTSLRESHRLGTRFRTSEYWFTSDDGTRLFYRTWRPASPTGNILVLFHRGHEHSGRWEDVVDALVPEGFSVFAWDARGNGRSEGPRDDAENFGRYARDAELFVRHVSETEGVPLQRIAVIGHSVGAAIAAAWIHDYAPPIRAAVLATPAFRIRLYVPFAIPALRLAQTLGILRSVPSYVKSRVLTHDASQRERHNADALISHAISSRVLIDLHDTARRVVQDAAAIRVPILVLVAGSDLVVGRRAQKAFFERLGSPIKHLELLRGFYHDVYHESNAVRPVKLTREFIEGAYAQAPLSQRLLDADREGYTFEEYQALSRPLPRFSGKSIYYRAIQSALRTVGRWSAGIRLGWDTGFNSGRTLDYVYRNQAAGFTPLGRLIDRQYLNGIGWQGIRMRRALLERTVQRAIEETHSRQGSVRLVDVAAGVGRYLLDTLKRCESLRPKAELRDVEPRNLEHGQATARSLGVENVSFVRADAFDPSLPDDAWDCFDIGIVSGLYELFPDNARVLRSLRRLASVIPEGGSLIYTNQPWHPQIELIARGLVDWDGRPWVMRRRTQAEMDDLVHAAGFEKTHMEIDRWGMFTVSLARRVR